MSYVLKPWLKLRTGVAVVALGVLTLAGFVLTELASFTTPENVTSASQYAASPLPDRIILTWEADPSTSQTVTWRTDTTISQGWAEITPATHHPDLIEESRQLAARVAYLDSDNGPAHYHTVTFTGLAPSGTYAYRVGDGELWSEWFHIQTAGLPSEPFSFLYFGDAQRKTLSLWSRTLRAAYQRAPFARFMIHAGDMVHHRGGNHDSEWGEWFDAGDWIHAMVPSIPVAGNHEYLENWRDAYVDLNPHWAKHFALPSNGPEELGQTVYYIDYQGVRIIVLDSTHALVFGSAYAQARWMESLLHENPNRWTIVIYHHPMFSIAHGREDPSPLHEHWKPLFERYGVDLALQGHDHAYGREATPAVQAGARRWQTGTVYVTSVSGPAMYSLAEDAEERLDRVGEDIQLFQVIHVEEERLRFEAYTATHELFDAFDLVRRYGHNELVETLPDSGGE